MKKVLPIVVLSMVAVLILTSAGASAYWWSYTPTTTCSDSDGKDYYNKGTVTYRYRDYTDGCYGSYVKEKYCSYNRVRTTYFKCPDGCSNGACITPVPQIVCGNGVVEGTEQCDDGNTQNGDGCSSTCQNQCAEDWSCTAWSACNANDYKSRSCTDLNSCGTTYMKPSTYTKGHVYNTWVWESEVVDVGNPASESGHNLTNWGPIEPDTNGGLWGFSPTGSSCCPYGTSPFDVAYDGSTRMVSTTSTGDSAELLVNIGTRNFYRSQYIEFMALRSVSGDDSFDVYLNGNPIYSYIDDGTRIEAVNNTCPENWVKHEIPITDTDIGIPVDWDGRNVPDSDHFYAVSNLTFVSTAPHWSGYSTYGQVAVSEITTGWKHNIEVCE